MKDQQKTSNIQPNTATTNTIYHSRITLQYFKGKIRIREKLQGTRTIGPGIGIGCDVGTDEIPGIDPGMPIGIWGGGRGKCW